MKYYLCNVGQHLACQQKSLRIGVSCNCECHPPVVADSIGITTKQLPGEPFRSLLCPICHDQNVHPVGIRLAPLSGDTNVHITSKGIESTPSDLGPHVRGIIIDMEFNCESGHGFVHRFSFHKGDTFVMTMESPDLCGLDTIWRD